MTAGSRLATAVPELVTTAAGLPVALLCPSAQKPSDRSSMQTLSRARGCIEMARVKGEEREPEEGESRGSRVGTDGACSHHDRQQEYFNMDSKDTSGI